MALKVKYYLKMRTFILPNLRHKVSNQIR